VQIENVEHFVFAAVYVERRFAAGAALEFQQRKVSMRVVRIGMDRELTSLVPHQAGPAGITGTLFEKQGGTHFLSPHPYTRSGGEI
jgi:hypothetical protein